MEDRALDLDLGRLRQVARAATAGPWARVDAPWGNGSLVSTGTGDPHGQATICDCDPMTRDDDLHDHPKLALAEDDAAFIAEWNPAVALALLARLEAAEAAAARAVAAKVNWQPIATAPKDGRALLVGFLDAHGYWFTKVGWWEEKWSRWDFPFAAFADPTHWAPLPAPPA